MSKITRIEDVTNIVGIKNYIAALSLDKERLKYQGYTRRLKGLVYNFLYDGYKIDIYIDKDRNMYNMNCNCSNTFDYCPHVALSIMYLLTHEEVVQNGIEHLEEEYDGVFNENLFENLSSTYKPKEHVKLEVILKKLNRDYEYELKIKIGINKRYVLTKRIDEFLEIYRLGTGSLIFGKDFTYDPKEQEFDLVDTKILDFLELYYDSQNNMFKNYYGYYTPHISINMIKLAGKSLLNFLEILKNKEFYIEEGYYTHKYLKINEDYNLKIDVSKKNQNIKVIIPYQSVTPLTKNYEYIIIDDNIYSCTNPRLLYTLIKNKKKQLLFKNNEIDSFFNFLLPELKKLDKNINVDSNLDKLFKDDIVLPKFYFDYEKNKIECKIYLVYQDIEKNILDYGSKFKDSYVIRNYEKEKQYIQDITKYGFVVNNEDKKFLLEEDDSIARFIDEDIKLLVEKYDVYMTKRMKEFRIIENTHVESQFKIGRDNILNFSFEIDDIDKKDIANIFDAIQLKKKYYKLKNGNWLNLDNNLELIKMGQMVNTLDISKKDLQNDIIAISRYKSLILDSMNDEYEFIKLDDSLHNFISKFKAYKDYDVTFTDFEKSLLREYQQTGIKWMLTLASCGFGGILADEMGLGKSLQTIKYIEKRKEEDNTRKFIIVVPTSLIYNWENEFKKFAPNLKFVVVNENKEKRHKLLLNSDDYDIYITTYGLLRQDMDIYDSYIFDTCIIDEAQNIKNIHAETTKAVKNIHAVNRFALTGTPIENSILELWSIFDFLMPGFMPNITKFKHMYSVKNIEDDETLLPSLNKKISPFILRRKKKDVLTELPDKIINNVLVELNKEQKQLYVSYLEKTKKEIDEVIKKDGFMKSQILVLSLLTRLRQICIDPKLIITDYEGNSSKIDSLIDIVEQTIENGHKMLLFSQFPSALKIVKQELKKKKIESYYLDGSTKSKERMELVNKFNQNDIPIFLISLKAGGTGLNLTSADVVIHLDPWWNPQVENQATDRSHRIGQKNVVEVVKLIAKGTIEEKIVELQIKKQKLSDEIIEGDNRNEIILSKLTEEELKDILNS